MKRRNFIKLSVLTSLSLLSPIDIFAKKTNKKTLVLIELAGGNDGLNTLVPFSSKKYYELRPNIALEKNELNILNSKFGLNKNLENIYNLYEENSVAIINGLGYENPNLSHFKSIQIVETAGTGNRMSDEGWISEHLREYKLNEKRPANALIISKRKRGYLFSKDLTVLQIENINSFINKAKELGISKNEMSTNKSLNFLYKQEKSIKNASISLKKYVQDIKIETVFDDNTLSKEFEEASRIIKSNLDIPVIKISQKGYDTHSNQIERQSELLKELDLALNSFVQELKKSKLYDDVLIMTYCEFGRRVKENASLGTDHGTANVQFVLGGKVKGGVFGDVNLNNLDKNNLIFTSDYKNLYNTVLTKWFGDINNKFNKYELIDFL